MKRLASKSPVITSIVLGIAAGMLCHLSPENGVGQAVAGALTAVSDVFLRLVRVLIAPLVLGTVVAGIGGVDSIRAVRRLGIKAAAWFGGASVVSLALAFGTISIMPPALFRLQGMAPIPAAEIPSIAPTVQTFLVHIVPRSIFEALAQNEMLQVATFAVLFGVALSTVKDVLGGRLVEVVEEFVIVMLQLTNLIMRLAPVAAFSATAAFTAKQGLGVIATYGAFVGGVLAGLILLSAATCLAAYAATFNFGDKYGPSEHPGGWYKVSHTGIYLGQNKDGVLILDQWRGKQGGASAHVIPWDQWSGRTAEAGNKYFTIRT